jgi:endonuclease III
LHFASLFFSLEQMKIDKKQQSANVIKLLKKLYPEAHCALIHENAFQLLIATILSAQCTDDRVNIVTATLFRKFPTPKSLADAEIEDITQEIKSINFFNNKAKSLKAMSQKLVENFGGEVPKTMEQLLTLNGVARKTANVVLGNAFGIASGVVVDTHVSRLSQRLGLTEETTPEKIEKNLAELVPKKDWVMFPHWMIFHGRQVCKARNPNCEECKLTEICPKVNV